MCLEVYLAMCLTVGLEVGLSVSNSVPEVTSCVPMYVSVFDTWVAKVYLWFQGDP